jgi:hypothetical protein
MKKRYLIPLVLSALISIGCAQEETIPPVTSEYPIGGCPEWDCGKLAVQELGSLAYEAYAIGTAKARALGQELGVHIVFETGDSNELCRSYGCGDNDIVHKIALRDAYAQGLHDEGFLNREDREYHKGYGKGLFWDSTGNDFRVIDHLSNGTTQYVWPCYHESDRQLAKDAYMKKMAELHPEKERSNYKTINGVNTLVTYEIGF